MCLCTFGRRGLSRLKGANAHSNEWGRRVESRTRYAIGGMSTVIASVAVVCAVALTNSVALADSVGVPVNATPVVVPSPTTHGRSVAVAQSGDAPAAAIAPAGPQLPATETVPAPAPIVVTYPAPSADVLQTTAVAAIAEAESSGTWEPVREWATRNSWSQARIDAWVQRLEEKRTAALDGLSNAPKEDAAQELQGAPASESSKTSARADRSTERQSAEPGFGSKKDQSRDSPDRRD